MASQAILLPNPLRAGTQPPRGWSRLVLPQPPRGWSCLKPFALHPVHWTKVPLPCLPNLHLGALSNQIQQFSTPRPNLHACQPASPPSKPYPPPATEYCKRALKALSTPNTAAHPQEAACPCPDPLARPAMPSQCPCHHHLWPPPVPQHPTCEPAMVESEPQSPATSCHPCEPWV